MKLLVVSNICSVRPLIHCTVQLVTLSVICVVYSVQLTKQSRGRKRLQMIA